MNKQKPTQNVATTIILWEEGTQRHKERCTISSIRINVALPLKVEQEGGTFRRKQRKWFHCFQRTVSVSRVDPSKKPLCFLNIYLFIYGLLFVWILFFL